ncbi:cold-shock protein [Parapedobacter sp. DT-150]|uniref:cold-shock protein n=1 Tax=Parapedobacter sp. DT-150 TaxID=3396162 RepID=UPI003F1C498A
MFIGAVKWFDNNKGFGVLALPLGEELFLHVRGFKGPLQDEIKPNEVIIGDRKPNQKREGYIAHNCRVLGQPEDWGAIVSLLGRADTVQLTDKRKKGQYHSLTELAAKQFLRGEDADSIFTLVTSHFDSSFEPSLFVSYASFLEKTITCRLGSNLATPLLSRIFAYFGSQMTHGILFKVWKAGEFRYIGFDQAGDYEIPEEVLNLNATEIDYEDLLRISKYSFGQAFCSSFVGALFDATDTAEMVALLPYLDFLENGDRAYWKNMIKQ